MTIDPTAASATRIAAAIRAGDLSSVEAVEACLHRIEAVNPRINAVVRFAADAIDRAEAADRDLALGRIHGPLHGVPCTLKDSLDTAGLVTTAGTIGWRDRVPTRDATVVARLKAAGAIVLGKTNTPEFTWSDETDNDVYGRTSNPYDLERTPGGSSGGAAAVVAAGGSPFDIGSDTGDSIRQPAHVCGVAGLKPSSGRVPGPVTGLVLAGSSRTSPNSGRSHAAPRTSRSSSGSSPAQTVTTRTSHPWTSAIRPTSRSGASASRCSRTTA